MVDADDDPPLADRLPEELIERLDALDTRQLRAVSEYVGEQLSHVDPPTEAEVRADATGTVVDVSRRDVYTLVWKRPSEEGEGDGVSPATSLYSVRREYTLDGGERLDWSYLGPVREAAETECSECGTAVAPYASTCPRCGCEIDAQQERE